ncbi:rhodanese-like domain-containing protein [Pedobacter sp. N36a]|uniref:rhodanese-like domain-containing protein n=1 Tax=Pedobacter sp. N36a TaxID=2767996 RepID=UPI001656A6FC|nr:rhodanese-like domain-containing protein [Pedobacter sp. N36a]MBC8985236.1 rhodanese-like domain-containing protein [Pedobacter sp. N36a]
MQAYTEINTTQLTVLQKEDSTLIIDVRERHELPLLDGKTYIKVPMSELADFLDTDPDEHNIIFICQHGVRSVAAAEALHDKYGSAKHLYSLKGGIAKWRNYFL